MGGARDHRLGELNSTDRGGEVLPPTTPRSRRENFYANKPFFGLKLSMLDNPDILFYYYYMKYFPDISLLSFTFFVRGKICKKLSESNGIQRDASDYT